MKQCKKKTEQIERNILIRGDNERRYKTDQIGIKIPMTGVAGDPFRQVFLPARAVPQVNLDTLKEISLKLMKTQ